MRASLTLRLLGLVAADGEADGEGEGGLVDAGGAGGGGGSGADGGAGDLAPNIVSVTAALTACRYCTAK